MHAIAFARRCGLTYVHSPFKEIAHADRPMKEWAAAWESHFNLGKNELPISPGSGKIVNFADVFNELVQLFGFESDDITALTREMLPVFRQKYYANKVAKKNEVLKVCVHVRRGDVSQDNTMYWLSNPVINRTISGVREVLESRSICHQISIFSEGNRADFADLEEPGMEFFLDADPVWTMQELIAADIFIMGKGSFSYAAALLSDGVKLYTPYHPPLSDWIVVDPTGAFDKTLLDRRLSSLSFNQR
jgi:hypothetical protein